ncbi:MAG: diaminopimelate epimerase [Gammaproteobacteria bacterium]|nr:diaminopimelate epimerase [Gammaproteobacteria bacterium]
MPLQFTKMHGLGNDFVVARGANPPAAARIRALADRHTGIGFDQLLWLEPARSADMDVFYRVFNADGGEVEQCGNGARCIARFLSDESAAAGQRNWRLGYAGGVVQAELQADGDVAVRIAVPDFSPAALPMRAPEGQQDRYRERLGATAVEFGAVSVGNPHAVITVPDVATAPVAEWGPVLESHERFPRRANIGFMQVVTPQHIKLRVYERGVGETLACGTGACAAAVVGRQSGDLAEEVTVSLPGGDLRVRWAGLGEPVWLIGEAVRAFDGVVAI